MSAQAPLYSGDGCLKMIAGAKLNQLDFSVTSISKRDRPHLLVGLLHAKPWQVAMIGLGTAATQLDTSVNIAFPAITRGFDLSIGDIQWVVICYVLTYASLLLAMGRIGDTVGHAVVFPDWPDLEHCCATPCRLVAEFWRHAAFSLPAGYWRCAGAELWRSAGNVFALTS